jgi:hypothetical protein
MHELPGAIFLAKDVRDTQHLEGWFVLTDDQRLTALDRVGGCLQPATHRALIGQVARQEAVLQVVLLSRDDHQRHQRHRWNEGDE